MVWAYSVVAGCKKEREDSQCFANEQYRQNKKLFSILKNDTDHAYEGGVIQNYCKWAN